MADDHPHLDLLVVNTKWLLYLAANFLFTCVRNISWLLNGTYWRMYKNQNPENYDQCAHVMQVIWKHRVDVFIEGRLSDYFLVHDRFESPEFIMRDDVTFLTVTASQAIFVQRQKGSPCPFTYNFIMEGQFATADKIITIPMNQFHRLAENMEKPKEKVIFLQNQSRCGGSLFSKIFYESGCCITFNEPHSLNALCKYMYTDGIWSKEEAARLFKNTIRVLCKPVHSRPDPTLAYVIKPTATSIMCAEMVSDLLPDAIQLFIYREPVQIAISLRRLGQALKTLKLMFHLPNIPGMIAPLFRFIGYVDIDFRGWTPRYDQTLEFGYRVACYTMHYYLTFRERGVKITGIKYEDLVKNKEGIIRQLFKTCQLPDKLIPLALEAMQKDSQGDMPFSQKNLKALNPRPPKPTTAFLEAARDMAKEFDVPGPDCWEDAFHLPGSLIV